MPLCVGQPAATRAYCGIDSIDVVGTRALMLPFDVKELAMQFGPYLAFQGWRYLSPSDRLAYLVGSGTYASHTHRANGDRIADRISLGIVHWASHRCTEYSADPDSAQPPIHWAVLVARYRRYDGEERYAVALVAGSESADARTYYPLDSCNIGVRWCVPWDKWWMEIMAIGLKGLTSVSLRAFLAPYLNSGMPRALACESFRDDLCLWETITCGDDPSAWEAIAGTPYVKPER